LMWQPRVKSLDIYPLGERESLFYRLLALARNLRRKQDPDCQKCSHRALSKFASGYPTTLFSILTSPFEVPTYKNRSSLVIAVTL
jgi:hypothetical protein